MIEQLIRARAEKIDAYVYIEPYQPHELDGTRTEITEEARAQNNARLKQMYAHYGIDLLIIDEPNRHERFTACIEAIQAVIGHA